MQPTPPQPVDRQIQGTLAQVEQRQQGWMRFHIMEGDNQYPTRVDTKKPELVQQAMSLLGQVVMANIREQESTNINPNSGNPYINRYLNEIAPAGQQQQYQQPVQQYQQPQQTNTQQVSGPPPPPPQPQIQPGLAGMDREIAIMRQTAAKVVAMSWEILPDAQQTPQGLIEACEVWMAYFVHGPLRFGVQPFAQDGQVDPEIINAQ